MTQPPTRHSRKTRPPSTRTMTADFDHLRQQIHPQIATSGVTYTIALLIPLIGLIMAARRYARGDTAHGNSVLLTALIGMLISLMVLA